MTGCRWLLVLAFAVAACTTGNPAFDPAARGDATAPAPDWGRQDARWWDSVPPPDQGVEPPRADLGPLPSRPVGVDVLFVVDNSPGMAVAQARLARDVDSLLGRLDGLPGGPNYRLGVVTTDMGVGQYTNQSCSGEGDAGELFLPASCPKPAGGKPYIERVADAANVADVDAALSCLLKVGDTGCGFEQPLEAARVALASKNKSFLRPAAALLVIVLANEDDCSVADPELFNPYAESFGPYASYRCFQFGALCNGKVPPLDADLLSGCVPAQGYLHQIKTRYVDPLRALKPPGWVAVLVFGGPAGGPIQVVEAKNAQGTFFKLAPSCQGANFSADPALRLDAWRAVFGERGHFASVCEASYREPLAKVVTSIRDRF